MSNATTIAIIGVAGKMKFSIATAFAKKYHVLLFDHHQDNLSAGCQQSMQIAKSGNLEMMHCPTNASWEADVIFLIGYNEPDQFIAEKIRKVATQKIVVVFEKKTDIDVLAVPEFTWQQLLPHSKLITVLGADFDTNGKLSKELVIESNDESVLKEGAALLKSAGFNIQTLFTPFIH